MEVNNTERGKPYKVDSALGGPFDHKDVSHRVLEERL